MNAKEQLSQMVREHDWNGVLTYLSRLSNMQFRKTESIMRESVLPELDNKLFWEALLHLIIYKRQAFLSGILASKHLADNGTLDFSTPHVAELATFLYHEQPSSIMKLCNMMVPLLKTEKQIQDMFKAMHVENAEKQIITLLKASSPLSYYLIFKILKTCDEKKIALNCCLAIMKRKDDMAFNAVCIIKAYHGLDELPGRFSLKIEQYELSHIDRDFETFQHALYGKRPQI